MGGGMWEIPAEGEGGANPGTINIERGKCA